MTENRIAVVDDHPLFRNALAQILRAGRCESEIEIVEAGSRDELLASLDKGLAVDLVTLDLGLPGLHGMLGLLNLRSSYPTVPVIVVSARTEPAIVGRCLMLGAAGFIPKSASRQQIRGAVEAVLRGDRWLPEGFDAEYLDSGALRSEPLAGLCSLSPRELQVCMALGRGLLNKQIAQQLDIAEATVKAHVSRILEKLDATSRTHAVVILQQLDSQVAGDGVSLEQVG